MNRFAKISLTLVSILALGALALAQDMKDDHAKPKPKIMMQKMVPHKAMKHHAMVKHHMAVRHHMVTKHHPMVRHHVMTKHHPMVMHHMMTKHHPVVHHKMVKHMPPAPKN